MNYDVWKSEPKLFYPDIEQRTALLDVLLEPIKCKIFFGITCRREGRGNT